MPSDIGTASGGNETRFDPLTPTIVPLSLRGRTAVANGIAAICLAVRDQFGLVPHVYFDWTEGSPLIHFLRFILWARARSRRSPARSCAGPNPTGPAARTCTRAEDRPDPGTPATSELQQCRYWLTLPGEGS